LSYTRKAL